MLTGRWHPAAVPLVLLSAMTANLGTLAPPGVVTSHAPQTTTGLNQGTNIPAANLAIVSINTPTAISGQPVDPRHGPMVPSLAPAGPLNSAQMVLHTNSGHGIGTYTQGITLSLTIPADTRAGTYTSTITTTTGSGP